MVPARGRLSARRTRPSGSSSRASASAACPASARCCPAPISGSPRATGDAARTFTGLEEPPPISANVPGREYMLTAATLGSVSPGSPIYYRGIDIGQVLGLPADRRRTGARHQDLRPGAVPQSGAHHQPVLERQRHQRRARAPRASTSRSRRCRRCWPAGSSSTRRSARPPARWPSAGTRFPLFPNERARRRGAVHREDPVPGLFRRLGPRPQSGRAGRVPRHHGRAR